MTDILNLYNYNSGNYRDRYTRATGWTKVLFNQGRPLQSTELIEMQSIMQDFLKQGLDTIFTNGSIVSGLVLSVLSTSSTELTLSLTSGQFYVDGIILDIPSQSLSVPNTTGETDIGILITPTVSTEVDNPSLRDPIKGGAVFGLPGASRLVWTPTIVTGNPAAYTIGKVVNGGLIQSQTTIYSQLDASLATYTYARTGNFCVSGLTPSIIQTQQATPTDTTGYANLQALATSTANATQTVYTQLTAANTSVTNLTTQLANNTATYNSNPTTYNLSLVNTTQQELTQAQNTYNTLAQLYASKLILSNQAQANLTAAQALLTSSITISISPGIAYVEGYRLDTLSPTLLQIPQSLGTSTVQDVEFTYGGSPATTIRNFSLVSGATWTDVVAEQSTLTLALTSLQYQGNAADVTLTFNLTSSSYVDIPSFLQFLVAQLNQGSSPILDPSITISSVALASSTPQTLLTVLNNNLIITASSNTLTFTSTSLTSVANQIGVAISINGINYSTSVVGTSTILLVDVASSDLAGAAVTNSYQLGFRPVANIISLTAQVAQNLKPLVRGPIPGTTDNLGSSSIYQINQVIQGSTTFTQGVDYRLINQSQIDWSISPSSSAQPTPGTTYYVSFYYTQPLALNTDYTLDSTDTITFIGTTPAPNQHFFVTYSYYLAQAGVITLDSKGNFNYQLSASSISPTPPTAASNLLTLATFTMYANSTTLNPSNCSVLQFSQLQTLANQVRQNTSAIQALQLTNQAVIQAANQGVTPIGYYNSTIQDLTVINLTAPLSTGSIAPGIQAVTGGYTQLDAPLTYTSGGTQQVDELGNTLYITLPYSSQILLSQSRLTTTTQVYPPGYANSRARMFISPPISFLDAPFNDFTSCDVLSQQTTALARTTNPSAILSGISTNNQVLFKSFGQQLYNSLLSGQPIGNYTQATSTFLGYISSNVTAASANIKVSIQGLTPNSDGYRLYLAGQVINAFILTNSTPISVAYSGAIKAKPDGTIWLNFNIPSGFSPGTYPLELISDASSGYAKGTLSIFNNLLSQVVYAALDNWDISYSIPVASSYLLCSKASSFDTPTFSASTALYNPGTIPSLTASTPTLDQQFPFIFDSIYQTFTVPDYYYLSSVNIMLSTQGSTYPLYVNLGEANDNGPTRSFYASATASTYSTSLGTWTTFTFPYPILLQPNTTYCISLYSLDSGYTVYSAQVGATDLITQSIVGDQLYLQGNMYSSPDGVSLNTLTSQDLTFQLIGCQFSTTSSTTVSLGSYGTPNLFSQITSFCLNNRDVVPPSTSIQYQYSLDNSTWVNFNPNSLTCLSSPTNLIYIQAVLSSSLQSVSPSILIAGSSVSLYSFLSNSTIVSYQTSYQSPYQNVAINLEYLQPAGTTISVYYSPNAGLPTDGQEWFALTQGTPIVIDQGLGVMQATWTYSNSSIFNVTGLSRTLFRFRIDFSTSNIAIQPTVLNIISYVS